MFDDPKKELRRMEQALLETEREAQLAEEEAELDALVEQYLHEDDEPEEDILSWAKRISQEEDEEPPIRNQANGYGMGEVYPDHRRALYENEDAEDDRMVQKGKGKKEKGIGGLLLLFLVELLGIMLVILWWLRWLNQ